MGENSDGNLLRCEAVTGVDKEFLKEECRVFSILVKTTANRFMHFYVTVC